MKPTLESQFIYFLEEDLSLPHESVSLALKHHSGDWNLLPIILWKYGLATLNQVSCMFDWLEARQK
ncbi:MAG: DUF2949 domain-containing protein [Leptolyngbya sp. SIO1E4]|nr:DUF2949 domain-containing protein [Leptolyngbya sp. SIO1E4]